MPAQRKNRLDGAQENRSDSPRKVARSMRAFSAPMAAGVLAVSAFLCPTPAWSFSSPYSENFDSYAVGGQPTGWSDPQSHWSAQTGSPSTDRDYRFTLAFANSGISIQSGEASVVQMTDLGL